MVVQLKKLTWNLPIKRTGAVVVVVIQSLVLCSIFGGVVIEGDGGSLDEISKSPHVIVNSAAEKGYTTNHGSFNIPKKIRAVAGEAGEQGKIAMNNNGHHNNISDLIKNGELSTIFCETCTDSQKHKVEQILYLLYNFNNNGVASSTDSTNNKEYVLRKIKKDHRPSKRKLSTTSSPSPHHRQNLLEVIATPDVLPFSRHNLQHHPLSRVIQIPNLSSTTPATSSSTYSSMAIPIVPYFYSSASTSPLPSSAATTLSSALEPSQSVEMPTPPMPPTTTGPIYLYYLGSQSSSLSSSGSLEPPTTSVVESSLSAFASNNPSSRKTTVEPTL